MNEFARPPGQATRSSDKVVSFKKFSFINDTVAEMVGSIGRRTAVANNDQIVEGITYGVREANDDVVTAIYAVAQQIIGAMQEQNNGNGSFDLGAYITRQQRETARMNG